MEMAVLRQAFVLPAGEIATRGTFFEAAAGSLSA